MKSISDPVSDLPALRAFVAVARLGSVGRAAGALGRTQPSVSARLAKLEAAWGVRLFVRRARGMALTPEGARLLPIAEVAIGAVEALDAAAGLPLGGPAALRVGAGDALGREVLPKTLATLLRETPGLSVRFVEGPGPRLLDALRGGEIDVALLVAPEPGVRTDGLSFAPILETRIEVFFPVGAAPKRRKVAIAELARERIVTLQSGSGFRRRLERLFEERGLRFDPAVELGNLSLVRRFVAAGAGVAAVPAIAFSERAPGPRIDRRELAEAPPIAYVSAVRSDAPLPEPARRFLQKL